jgi:hypothetical protein
MVLIIKDLADDPLKKPKKPGDTQLADEIMAGIDSKGNETAELEETIAKIGRLL